MQRVANFTLTTRQEPLKLNQMDDNYLTEGEVQNPVHFLPPQDAVVQFFAQAVKVIKECRKLTDTSQAELARQTSIDRRKIMALESGERDFDTLIKLCDYYDVRLRMEVL